MAIFDFLDPSTQFGSALQQIGNVDRNYRNDMHMQRVMAANPAYGKALYGLKNEQEELELAKKIALLKIQRGADQPAALQLTNAYLQAKNSGDTERANALASFAKIYDKGVGYDQLTGTYTDLPGYGGALGALGAAKKGAEQQAVKNVDLTMDPLIKRAESEAAAIGKGVGETKAEQDKKEIKAPDISNLIKKARDVLPQSTSGFIDQGITGAAKIGGRSTDASKADAQLKVLSAALTSTVPRFEGPQGVLDVELYKQAAADVANTSLPYEDRLAALDTMESLNNRYLSDSGEKAADDKTAAPGKLIGTSGGKKVYQLEDGSYVMEK